MAFSRNIRKAAFDMTMVQLIWAAWFVAILLIIFVGIRVFGGMIELNERAISGYPFLDFIYQPARVFMLVIGLNSVSGFLVYFVKNGVTRKDYFYGAAAASAAVALAIALSAGIASLLLPWKGIASEPPLIGSWAGSVAAYVLNLLVFYAAGWLIGSGFYRFDSNGGVLYIILAVLLSVVIDVLWNLEFDGIGKLLFRISGFDAAWHFPFAASVLGTLLLFGLMLWIVRMTTKRVRVKLK